MLVDGLSVTDGSGTLPRRIAANRMDPKTGERIFVFSKVPLPQCVGNKNL